jgi:hypothetical protein
MFLGKDKDYLESRLFTTSYLGRQEFADEFFALVSRYGGIYVPEKWDTEERTRRSFDRDSLGRVIGEWTSGRDMKDLFFERKKPVEIMMFLSIERFARAKFNDFSAYLRDKYFKQPGKVEEFLRFSLDLGQAFRVDYGFIAHTLQERRQSPILTPAERLPGIYWANFFGPSYIEFFGRDKLLATPCYEVREINEDLILLLASESPYNPDMLDNDRVAEGIKEYLGQNAFPGPLFPDEPCDVPLFNFSDVRGEPASEPVPSESVGERVKRTRLELESKGYTVSKEAEGQLILRGQDGSVILVDVNTGAISLDTTGLLLSTDKTGSGQL